MSIYDDMPNHLFDELLAIGKKISLADFIGFVDDFADSADNLRLHPLVTRLVDPEVLEKMGVKLVTPDQLPN